MTDSKTIVREINKITKVWSSMWHKVPNSRVFKTRKLCLWSYILWLIVISNVTSVRSDLDFVLKIVIIRSFEDVNITCRKMARLVQKLIVNIVWRHQFKNLITINRGEIASKLWWRNEVQRSCQIMSEYNNMSWNRLKICY